MATLRSLCLILVFLCILSDQTTTAKSFPTPQKLEQETAFTPKYIYKAIKTFPKFLFPSAKEDSRTSPSALENAFETLEASANLGENWFSFGKRLLNYFFTGSKQIRKEGRLMNEEFARKFYDSSPQFLKDIIQVQLDGSIIPTLEKKVHDIIQTIKEKNGTYVEAESKQLTPFDPVVFGTNAMLNLMYFTTLSK